MINKQRTYFLISILILGSCGLLKKSTGIKKDEQSVKYANTITSEELKKHLSIIASDEYEGRETGRKGQRMTAEYLKKEFITYGVKPGNNGDYFQYFDLVETNAPIAGIKVNGESYSYLKDFYFFQSYSDFSNFTISKSSIYPISKGIVEGERDDYGSKNYNGKTLIISIDKEEGFDSWNWRKKLKLAKDKGAERVFFTSSNFESNIERLSHFLEGSSMKLKTKEKKNLENIPFFFISNKLEKEILKENVDNNKIEFAIISQNEEITSTNVLGFIEGTDPELKKEIIVITAHYDHLGIKDGLVYNGADDDGTGTVALLEIAEAFQKAKNEGNGVKRSILIMPVSGEEKGLLGSSYYSDNPIYPTANTVVDLNIDMIGRLDENHKKPDYVYLIGADKISKELHDISEATNETYIGLNLDYTFNDENDPNRFYYRSDHYNFAKKGIPVIFYFSGVHEDYHKATDEIDKIMFDKVETITRLVFHTAWEIANKKERLKIDEK